MRARIARKESVKQKVTDGKEGKVKIIATGPASSFNILLRSIGIYVNNLL